MGSSHEAGFAIVPAEVLDLGNGHAIAVYAAIAKHADRNGEAFPSVRRIGEITGWSRTTIHKTIHELEVAGAIVKEARTKNGLIRSNLYRPPLHGRKSPENGMSTTLPTDNPLSTSRPTLSTSRTLVGKEMDTEQDSVNQTQGTREGSATADLPRSQDGKSTNARRQRIPEAWTPSPEELHSLREKLSVTDAFLEREIVKFRDYYIARGDTMADWTAAWRNWMRRALEYSAKNGNGSGPHLATPPPTPIPKKKLKDGPGNPLEGFFDDDEERAL